MIRSTPSFLLSSSKRIAAPPIADRTTTMSLLSRLSSRRSLSLLTSSSSTMIDTAVRSTSALSSTIHTHHHIHSNDNRHHLARLIPNSSSGSSHHSSSIVTTTRRCYSPMTPEEEEREKARVSHLSPKDKDAELRSYNRQIAKLEMLKGINTLEYYTWTGRYKTLLRDYGVPLLCYYWVCWATMGVTTYLAMDVGGVDAMEVLAKIDAYLPPDWNVLDKVDPQMGKIGLALVVNETLEPIRLPFVVATLKPVMERISPPKY